MHILILLFLETRVCGFRQKWANVANSDRIAKQSDWHVFPLQGSCIDIRHIIKLAVCVSVLDGVHTHVHASRARSLERLSESSGLNRPMLSWDPGYLRSKFRQQSISRSGAAAVQTRMKPNAPHGYSQPDPDSIDRLGQNFPNPDRVSNGSDWMQDWLKPAPAD